MNTSTKLIDQYLGNEMSPGEKYVFEERLETDGELRTELEQQRAVLQGIEFSGIRREVRQGLKRGALKIRTRRLAIGVSAVALLLSLVVGGVKYSAEAQAEEKGTKTEIIYSKLPEKNGLPETPPPLDVKTDIKVTEKQEKQSGLTAGNNREAEHSSLRDKKIRTGPKQIIAHSENANAQQTDANVADPGKSEKIMLFGGKRSPDGQIHWLGHKSVSTLASGDSSELNLYSKHFLDSLKNAGTSFKNQQLSDSVYKSFLDSGTTKIFESDTTKK